MIPVKLPAANPTRARRRPATTAVEFAVIALPFVIIIFGIVEIARGIMVQHQLTDAARVGCRVGVIEGRSDTDVNTAVNNTLTSMGMSGATTTVMVNDVVTNSSNANAYDEITVRITVPASQVSWLPFLKYLSGNITGQYTLRRE
jgi:Flp pilus assembly protein TadG